MQMILKTMSYTMEKLHETTQKRRFGSDDVPFRLGDFWGEPVVNFLGCIWDKDQPLGSSGSRPEGLHCYSDTSGVGQACQPAGISHDSSPISES